MTRQLLETEALSEPLEPLDAELAFVLYGLEDAGLPLEQLISASAFRSTGATCEEVALFTFADETVAQTAAATIATAAVMSEVNWPMVVSASVLAGILSLLTSIAGLPEVEK